MQPLDDTSYRIRPGVYEQTGKFYIEHYEDGDWVEVRVEWSKYAAKQWIKRDGGNVVVD